MPGSDNFEARTWRSGRINGTPLSDGNLTDLEVRIGNAFAEVPTQAELDTALESVASKAQLSARPAILTPRISKLTKTFTGFQSGHGWSSSGFGTINLNDTTRSKLGFGQSVGFTTNGTGGGNFLTSALQSPVLDFTNVASVSVAFYKTTATQFAGNTLYLGSDTNFGNTFTINASSGSFQDGEWVWMTYNLPDRTTLAGSPALNNIGAVRLRLADTSGSPVAGSIGAVVFNYKSTNYPNGVVSFTLDDSYASHYTKAAPILVRKGYTAHVFGICDLVGTGGGQATMAQFREMHDLHGFGFGAHSYTAAQHNLTNAFKDITLAELETNLQLNRQWLIDNGLFRGSSLFAWPKSAYTDAMIEVAERYFACSWAATNTPRCTWPLPPDRHALRRIIMDASTTYSFMQGEIDKAYANQQHLLIGVHGLVDSGATGMDVNVSVYQQVVDYVESKGIAVRGLEDVLRSEP